MTTAEIPTEPAFLYVDRPFGMFVQVRPFTAEEQAALIEAINQHPFFGKLTVMRGDGTDA